VLQFNEVFWKKSKGEAAILNVCQPAKERWQARHTAAATDHRRLKSLFERAKASGDAVLIANAENELKEAKTELDALGMFKADLMSFTRYYEFMSQIVDYDSTDLERLSLYARHLAPLLREAIPEEDPIDLSSVQLRHYRLSKLREQDLALVKEGPSGLEPASALGSGKARDMQEAFLSQIIQRLNELFETDNLTDADMLSYAETIRDKVAENAAVMHQLANNAPEQAFLGDFPTAMDDAVMASGQAHQNQMMQYLNNRDIAEGFQRLVFEMLLATQAKKRTSSVPPRNYPRR
jgi:type I restriction enzyme, R subunit